MPMMLRGGRLIMSEVLFLETEVSRVDCRLNDRRGRMRHFCTLDRIDAETAQIVGVTFAIPPSLVRNFITAAQAAGFKNIQYERVGAGGLVRARVKYDIENGKFVKKEILK